MDSKLNHFTSTLMQRVLTCWDTGRPKALVHTLDMLMLWSWVVRWGISYGRRRLWSQKGPGTHPAGHVTLGVLVTTYYCEESMWWRERRKESTSLGACLEFRRLRLWSLWWGARQQTHRHGPGTGAESLCSFCWSEGRRMRATWHGVSPPVTLPSKATPPNPS